MAKTYATGTAAIIGAVTIDGELRIGTFVEMEPDDARGVNIEAVFQQRVSLVPADDLTVTPDLVADMAHKAYRLRLDSDADRECFDALDPKKQKYRTSGFEPVTRAVMLALGYSEPERVKSAKAEG